MKAKDVLIRHRLYRAELLLETANGICDEHIVNEAITKAVVLIQSTIELVEDDQ